MTVLPQALAPLAQYNQWICWKLSEREGKTVKLPCDITGNVCNVQDPAAWVNATAALAASEALGIGYGFVFAKTDPFFFLDIDKCNEGGKWSELALSLIHRLPGACVEVSQSGNGLHIFGTGTVPVHACKNVPLGLELYTEARFCALTGRSAQGDASIDCTAAITEIVTSYFPVTDSSDQGEWSDEPIDEWNGPTDDSILIAKALRTVSVGAAFDGKASFKNLWEADHDALCTAFPDGDSYDASSADAALASHLAFWTGCNHERIQTLMQQSALHRDKWDNREAYYLPRTIRRAVAVQSKVYTAGADRGVPATQGSHATNAPMGPTTGSSAQLLGGYQYLSASDQIEMFDRCVYIRDIHRVMISDGSLLRADQFRAMFGGHVFALDTTGEATTKNAWEAFTESQCVRYRKAVGMVFKPDLDPHSFVKRDGMDYINSYVPIEVDSVGGDVSRFLDHVTKVLPDKGDQQIIIAYMAACIQHKGVKFQWAPLLQGCEGNGKTLFARCIIHALGRKFCHTPRADEIESQFNGWIANKMFVAVEEVHVTEHKGAVMDVLKKYVTARDEGIEIQYKGADQYTGEIVCNFMFTSNYKDAVRKTKLDRRFSVFYTAQQSAGDIDAVGMGGDYFPSLYVWLNNGGYANVTHFLQNYAIPSHLNPATDCHRAPDTSSTSEVLAHCLGGIEQRVMDAIGQGRPGFRNGWVSSMQLDILLNSLNVGSRITPTKRHELLLTIGYSLHPHLPDGRTREPVGFDGGCPQLYVADGHTNTALEGPAIVKQYLDDQGVIFPVDTEHSSS